eukprot:g1592.t1
MSAYGKTQGVERLRKRYVRWDSATRFPDVKSNVSTKKRSRWSSWEKKKTSHKVEKNVHKTEEKIDLDPDLESFYGQENDDFVEHEDGTEDKYTYSLKYYGVSDGQMGVLTSRRPICYKALALPHTHREKTQLEIECQYKLDPNYVYHLTSAGRKGRDKPVAHVPLQEVPIREEEVEEKQALETMVLPTEKMEPTEVENMEEQNRVSVSPQTLDVDIPKRKALVDNESNGNLPSPDLVATPQPWIDESYMSLRHYYGIDNKESNAQSEEKQRHQESNEQQRPLSSPTLKRHVPNSLSTSKSPKALADLVDVRPLTADGFANSRRLQQSASTPLIRGHSANNVGSTGHAVHSQFSGWKLSAKHRRGKSAGYISESSPNNRGLDSPLRRSQSANLGTLSPAGSPSEEIRLQRVRERSDRALQSSVIRQRRANFPLHYKIYDYQQKYPQPNNGSNNSLGGPGRSASHPNLHVSVNNDAASLQFAVLRERALLEEQEKMETVTQRWTNKIRIRNPRQFYSNQTMKKRSPERNVRSAGGFHISMGTGRFPQVKRRAHSGQRSTKKKKKKIYVRPQRLQPLTSSTTATQTIHVRPKSSPVASNTYPPLDFSQEYHQQREDISDRIEPLATDDIDPQAELYIKFLMLKKKL